MENIIDANHMGTHLTVGDRKLSKTGSCLAMNKVLVLI